MKKQLLIIVLFFSFQNGFSQAIFGGLTTDCNTSIKTPGTGALGLHLEVGLGESNWFLNWHFSAGSTTNSDFFGHANILVLCYGNSSYWRGAVAPSSSGHNHPLAGLLAAAILPIACPIGVTNYFYTSKSNDLRVGFYVNPFCLDYWDLRSKPVKSWSVETGFKVLRQKNNRSIYFFSAGLTKLKNLEYYQNAGDANRLMFNFSVGIMGGSIN